QKITQPFHNSFSPSVPLITMATEQTDSSTPLGEERERLPSFSQLFASISSDTSLPPHHSPMSITELCNNSNNNTEANGTSTDDDSKARHPDPDVLMAAEALGDMAKSTPSQSQSSGGTLASRVYN